MWMGRIIYYHDDPGVEEMVTVGRVTFDSRGIEVEEEMKTCDGRGGIEVEEEMATYDDCCIEVAEEMAPYDDWY